MIISNVRTLSAFPGACEPKKISSGAHGPGGYIVSSVVLSIGLSQAVSALVILVKTISSIWHSISLTMYSLRIAVREGQVKSLRHRITVLQRDPINNAAKLQGQEAELQRLQALLTIDRTARQESIVTLKENAHSLVAAFLGAIPLVGILSAGAYAAAIGKGGSTGSFSERSATGASILLLDFLGKIPCLTRVGKSLFFPLSYDKSLYGPLDQVTDKKVYFDSIKVDLPVERGDGKKHSIMLHEMKTENLKARTMVLFPGNDGPGTNMFDLADFYHKEQWNVIMVTMGGYPQSDLGLETTEQTLIQDVKAVLQMVEKRGVEHIGVLGHSMGASLAMHATQLSDKVQFAILDKPFSSAKNVAANRIRQGEKEIPLLRCIPSAFVRAFITSSLPEGRIVPGVFDKNGHAYYTDGLDNVAKAKVFEKPIICIGGNRDDVMGYSPLYDSHGNLSHFQRTFADDIGEISHCPQFVITLNEGHVKLSKEILKEKVMTLFLVHS